jgi:hypothetical protein
MAAKTLDITKLQVESFSTILPDNDDYNETYTGFYGTACVSLPPNCLQTARKCY